MLELSSLHFPAKSTTLLSDAKFVMPLSCCASCDCRVPPRADPLGIPTVFYFLLSHQRSSINPPIDMNLEELRGTQHAMVSTPVEPLRPNYHTYI